ncbi:helix-turn-helix transcriptional regulator [Actinokineospora inagensis]|uniref:helix-turn-helix transcriptional regulator n=1 Tax=Actinokineospora inagensis TaxID=103730 RepID=UPI00042335DC|nr:helix-turn-helix transcriptional regulator [Actinokineospora inagensis]
MQTNIELKEFLRSRRDRLSADETVAVGAGPRRVPGLRREEVARLAGVSVDYYARLEQGRNLNVSDEVIAAVGRALRLDDVEHAHLARLVRRDRIRGRCPGTVQRVRHSVRTLLRSLDTAGCPAFVFGRRMDVLAGNRLGAALVTDFDTRPRRDRNMLRYVFLDPAAQTLYTDWDDVARESVAILRLDAGRHPDDPLLTELVDDLAARSPEFRRWWAAADVRERSHGTKSYHHPLVGDLTVDYECLTLPADPDQTLCVYTPRPGSPSADAIRLLAGLTIAPSGLS